jgi:hypothetical protein
MERNLEKRELRIREITTMTIRKVETESRQDRWMTGR